MDIEKISFRVYLEKRIKESTVNFFNKNVIKKAYYIGAYSKAVIDSSWNSKVSNKNETFKKWLSNQIINYRNLDRIFEMAYRFEQKLRLNIRNETEVRTLAHEVPIGDVAGISNAKITFAFAAGFDDYKKFKREYPTIDKNKIDKEKKDE